MSHPYILDQFTLRWVYPLRSICFLLYFSAFQLVMAASNAVLLGDATMDQVHSIMTP